MHNGRVRLPQVGLAGGEDVASQLLKHIQPAPGVEAALVPKTHSLLHPVTTVCLSLSLTEGRGTAALQTQLR